MTARPITPAGRLGAAPAVRRRRGGATALFLAAHVLLAITLAPGGSSVLATVHALTTLLVALYLVLRAPRKWAAGAAGYIVGAEVLWRMTEARVLWEYGKYASGLVLLVALWRMGRGARWRWLPLLYVLCMLPSLMVLAADPTLPDALIFDMASFNLSGPLALAVSVWCLSQLDLKQEGERRALLGLATPLMATGLVTLIRTMTATDLAFTAESNFATSGGFGPNQVSVALGLGAFLAFVYAVRAGLRSGQALLALGLAVFLAAQAALTLSRGGFYGFALAAGVTALALLPDARMRRRVLGLAIPAVLVAGAVLLPRLDSFTGGALVARFEDRQSSGRNDILKEDLRIWREHPLLGTGPGGARVLRRTSSTISHTEYSRLLAEHGVFGMLALALIGLMSLTVLRRVLRGADGAMGMGLLVWSLVSMSHAGMRIAAIGFVFGLAHARFASLRRAPAAGRAGRPSRRAGVAAPAVPAPLSTLTSPPRHAPRARR